MVPFVAALLAAACVASPSHRASSFSPYGSAPARGTGPGWAVTPLDHGAIRFRRRSNGTYAAKVLWIVAPRFRDELYIDVYGGRFQGGSRHLFGTSTARWRDQPSTVLVTRPGCLRFQIGGPEGFARRITVPAAIY